MIIGGIYPEYSTKGEFKQTSVSFYDPIKNKIKHIIFKRQGIDDIRYSSLVAEDIYKECKLLNPDFILYGYSSVKKDPFFSKVITKLEHLLFLNKKIFDGAGAKTLVEVEKRLIRANLLIPFNNKNDILKFFQEKYSININKDVLNSTLLCFLGCNLELQTMKLYDTKFLIYVSKQRYSKRYKNKTSRYSPIYINEGKNEIL